MRSSLLVLGFAALLLATCFGPSYAGQIWTDGNGDGLPDGCPGTFSIPPSSNVTIGIWIDSQSFVWTNFLCYVEWTGDCMSYVSAEYVITGGNNFPMISDQPPSWGGNGYNESGVDHIGNVTLHINTPVTCCVAPIIDIYNPYYVFSQLGNGSAYFLFSTNPGTCFGTPPPVSGACCFTDGSCQEIDASTCASAGGVYQGDCTVCSDQCVSTSVEPSTWGRLKGLFR